jgi:hypothetical protein
VVTNVLDETVASIFRAEGSQVGKWIGKTEWLMGTGKIEEAMKRALSQTTTIKIFTAVKAFLLFKELI